jgi:5-methylcytosine-specific restriction enzyme subunit McrC
MTALIEIDELDRKGKALSLTQSEERVLKRVQDRIGVEWHPSGGARVYSVGLVGSVALSPQTLIRITTKVPIANLLGLASLAYQTLPIPATAGQTLINSTEWVVDWLAVLLVSELEQLLAYGIRLGYVAVHDDLPYVRGRIRFDSTYAWTHPGLASCEFADYLSNTPENQLLRATLELLATRRLLPGLRLRISRLLPSLHGVNLVQPTRALLESCRITRLNQHYGPALELCRLVFEQAGLEENYGGVRVPAFFFPVHKVFERALANMLRSEFGNVALQTGRHYKPVSGSGPSVSYAADIVVGSPPRLVIDTKYALAEPQNQFGAQSFDNGHIYQVVFYALSLGCPALLVYPRADRDVWATFDVEGIRVSILTVDLQQPGLASLRKLVEVVADLSKAEAVA